ncbi:CinA family nicotinamide mononucleotide deamidase-related protein [Flavobacterium oreochromis]|uniref:CinA family nicotinamide mononucleotide deamidase-related protein n=1 Tax=Flavobacterium oreochromis TaxID=2906078 RepID=UPI000CDA5E8A|nr:CinA family nicotinamide mononucleotide deamidase-related protein [Flavobacterium oreochromis]POR30582.1 damage-inducible protein CinA [Flavobacterium columnare]QYS85637.1 CinA family nicotinamide mononucleotide deamidase-related protein [Flavobacterium oreochromis]
MRAAIVTIGDEILIGQITDTNSAYIAKSLDKIGIQTIEMLSISDDKEHILKTLSYLQDQVEIVVITGGLGPTKDDITKKTLCQYLDDVLVYDQDVLAHVTTLIENYFKRPITQLNKDQALIPSNSKVLFNQVGTAPGMWMEKGKTVFVSLPGVPYEMKHLIDHEVVPRLVEKFDRPYIYHQTLMTYGVGESLLAERIEEWESGLPDFIKLAYLPSPFQVKLRLTARGNNEQFLKQKVALEIEKVKPLIQDCLVGLDEGETIEFVLGKLLTQKKMTLSVAESCTGGKMASLLTAVSGASVYFKGGIVSYATEIKEELLKIDKELIKECSVVSEQVAEMMAKNVKELLKTDFAIATTGNAGPSKGESDAEVGTVYVAIATPKNVLVEKCELGQPREKVIERAVNKGFEMLYKEILKNY